jgi:hypothetical protein
MDDQTLCLSVCFAELESIKYVIITDTNRGVARVVGVVLLARAAEVEQR